MICFCLSLKPLNNYLINFSNFRNRNPLRNRHLMQIESENEKMKKRLNNVKGSINLKKMVKLMLKKLS